MDVEIRLFGPITAYADGNRVALGGPLHQLVLAALVVNGRPMSKSSLIDRLWSAEQSDAPGPRNPDQRLYDTISELRHSFRKAGGDKADIIPASRGGYCLSVEPDQVDLHRFNDLRGRARQELAAAADDKAVRLFREAFWQWNGSTADRRIVDAGLEHAAVADPHSTVPLDGLPGRWASNVRERLLRDYDTDLLACLDAELRLGHHHRVIPELVQLNDARPQDEHVASLLMLAYYRAGQAANAHQAFSRTRERVIDEIGDEPGAPLQELHQRILRQDPGLLNTSARSTSDRIVSPTASAKEHTMTEYFINVASPGSTVNGQISKNYGDIYVDSSAAQTLPQRAAKLQRMLADALKGNRVGARIAAAAENELGQALACLDRNDPAGRHEAVIRLENFRRLVSDVDGLGTMTDAVITAVRQVDR